MAELAKPVYRGADEVLVRFNTNGNSENVEATYSEWVPHDPVKSETNLSYFQPGGVCVRCLAPPMLVSPQLPLTPTPSCPHSELKPIWTSSDSIQFLLAVCFISHFLISVHFRVIFFVFLVAFYTTTGSESDPLTQIIVIYDEEPSTLVTLGQADVGEFLRGLRF